MGTAVIVGQNMPDKILDCVVDMHDRTIMFEPVPQAAEACRKRYATQPKAIVIEAACGEEHGKCVFNLYNTDGLSSSLGNITAQAEGTWRNVDFSNTTPIHVQVVRLDHVLQMLGVTQIDCLVIDAQGMDFAILKTLEPMINNGMIGYIQLEADGAGCCHYTGTPDNSEAAILQWMSQFEQYEASRLPGRMVEQPDLVFTLKE
jgi:FkbM family methyltransferase